MGGRGELDAKSWIRWSQISSDTTPMVFILCFSLSIYVYMCVCVCVCVGMYVGEVGTIIDTGNENSATNRSFGFGFGTLALFG